MNKLQLLTGLFQHAKSKGIQYAIIALLALVIVLEFITKM